MITKLIYYIRRLFKTPFKIALISYHYPYKKNTNNGVASHVYYLSRKLAELGCDVHIFTSYDRKEIKEEYIGNGKVIIHAINTRVKTQVENVVIKKRLSYITFDNEIIHEIIKENKDGKFDIIHTHGWLTSGAFRSKFFNDVRWVHTLHAVEKNRLKFMSTDEKKFLKISNWIESTIKHANALIAVSNFLKKEIIRTYHFNEKKVFFIPNGVDLDIFNAKYKKKGKIILYIGRFSLEKGIDLVYEIAEKVLKKDKKSKFIIVAPTSVFLPPSLKGIKEKFEEMQKKYEERFTFYKDNLSKEEIKTLYERASICIQPSRYESFGLVPLEAMACGCAVICSNTGGLPEVVSNAGIIAKLDSGTFVKNITKLLKNNKLREKYSKRSLERAKLFDWNDIAKKTLDLYKSVI